MSYSLALVSQRKHLFGLNILCFRNGNFTYVFGEEVKEF